MISEIKELVKLGDDFVQGNGPSEQRAEATQARVNFRLLEALFEHSHPNTTAYLILFYWNKGDYDSAGREYRADYDKLGKLRPKIFEMLMSHPDSAKHL